MEESRRRPRSAPPPLEDAWRQEFQVLERQWEKLRLSAKKPIAVPILRVYQMDAARLDVELTGMLKEQLMKVFSLSQPGLVSRYEPELNALLEFLIWRFSIWVDRPTPGNSLMNLRFRDERAYDALAAAGRVRNLLEGPGLTKAQKLCYCLALVGGRYGWARLQMLSAFQRWGDYERSSWASWGWSLLERLESVCNVASFFNLLLFMYTGRYRTIVERILRARLVYIKPYMNRAISFEYMNRQLVWHEFSELLLLVLPLLNLMSMKKLAFPFLNGQPTVSSHPDDTCPICERSPIVVSFSAIPCGHAYCYYCLRTRCIANSSFRCMRCNSNILAIRRCQQPVSSTRSSADERGPS